MPSSRPPRFTASQRYHAYWLDTCRGRRVGHAKASNHADPLRTARMRAAASWAASRRPQRSHGGARKSRLRCLSASCAAAHAHSTQPAVGLQRAKVLTATLRRFTRFDPGLDGSLETTRAQGPIYSARAYRVGGSRGRYTRLDGFRPSRGAEMSFYWTP